VKASPINREIHEVLVRKNFLWKPKTHMDMYHKGDTVVYVYMRDHAFMIINGRVATSKEFEDATQLSE
jgi:hypothetical protein